MATINKLKAIEQELRSLLLQFNQKLGEAADAGMSTDITVCDRHMRMGDATVQKVVGIRCVIDIESVSVHLGDD